MRLKAEASQFGHGCRRPPARRLGMVFSDLQIVVTVVVLISYYSYSWKWGFSESLLTCTKLIINKIIAMFMRVLT